MVKLTSFLILFIVSFQPCYLFGQENSNLDYELVLAVASGKVALVDSLLQQGAIANSKNNRGQTCLITASSRGYKDIVSLLLENNADIELTYNSNSNALIAASRRGHIEVVRLLLKHGANPNVSRGYRGTAINSAIYKGYNDVIKLLIDNGGDTNIPDKTGRTPLFEAIVYGKIALMKLLLEKGADINIQDERGNTPLLLTLSSRRKDIAQIVTALLDYYPDLSIADNSGRTAMMIAADNNDGESMKLLLEHGADKNEIGQDTLEMVLNPKEVPDEFLGYWMNKSYFEDLKVKKSPMQSRLGSIPVLHFKKEHEVMVTNSNEGWDEKILVKNENELIFYHNGYDKKYTARMIKTNSGKEIVLIDKKGNESRHLPYPKKYGNSPPPAYLINDIIFAGKYIVDSSLKSEVTFTIEGNVSGIRDFVRYRIGYMSFYPPGFNYINFTKMGERKSQLYHWKFEGDTLCLYNCNEVGDINYEIGELFMKLIKVSK